jgi:hypothetical protein
MVDEGRGWMYSGWKKSEAHTREWMNKTREFIDCAFSVPANQGVKCPCSRCKNILCEDKRTLTLHICKLISCQAMRCGRIMVSQSVRELHQ